MVAVVPARRSDVRSRIAQMGRRDHKRLGTFCRLALRCCEYEPLRLSENRGIAVVKPGQIVVGGEVFNGDRQYAFDYISDIAKHMKKDGT